MKKKSIGHFLVLAATSLLPCLCLPTASRADTTIPAGYDYFSTDPTGTTFGGTNFHGVPIGPGQTDTIVQRLGAADLPPGGSVNVSVLVDAMQLESVGAMFGSENGFLTLNPALTSGGTENINANGTFTSTLNVYFDVYAGSLTGTSEGTVAFSLNGSGNWSSTPGGFHEATSYFDVTPDISFDDSAWTTAGQGGDMTLDGVSDATSTLALLSLPLVVFALGAARGKAARRV
jgi:hypothetical protein